MLESDVKQLYNDWLVKDFGSMKKIEVRVWPLDSLFLYMSIVYVCKKGNIMYIISNNNDSIITKLEMHW